MLLHQFAGIAWDPQIRGFLAVAVGVVVLMGSVYLLLSTNLGSRLGFLVAISAVFGWCTIMGLTWWVYGSIGMLGNINKWEVKEVVYPGLQDAALPEAHTLDTTALPKPAVLNKLEGDAYTTLRDRVEPTLGGWHLLPQSDPSFGEAKAAVDEYVVAHPIQEVGVKTAADYVPVYSFQRGGKDRLPDHPSRLDRMRVKLKNTFWQIQHPPHYAIVEVQPVLVQPVVAGEKPPLPVGDPAKPIVSVIMERNLGDRRFPGFMLTISAGLMFAASISILHRRDLKVAEVRGLIPAATER